MTPLLYKNDVFFQLDRSLVYWYENHRNIEKFPTRPIPSLVIPSATFQSLCYFGEIYNKWELVSASYWLLKMHSEHQIYFLSKESRNQIFTFLLSHCYTFAFLHLGNEVIKKWEVKILCKCKNKRFHTTCTTW